MEHAIDHRPSYAQLTLHLDTGEAIVAESGAMVSHGPGLEVRTEASGGLIDSLKRSAFGGESFFMNTFAATADTQVSLAPALPGDIVRHDVDGTLLVQSGSFLAGDEDLAVDTRFGGGKTFFGGEGLFLLELAGSGPVFLSSYGAIDTHDLADGESFTVDTGHIVAFEDTTDFDVRRVGGLKSTLFSGEGLVCEFSGPGRVWTQTRSTDALIAWLAPKLPARNSN